MAKITDPDLLNRNTEVYIDPTTVPPKVGFEPDTGNLDDGGCSLQALYSFLKEQWKSQTDLIKYPFPIVAIMPEQFEFVDDWVPSGQTTIDLFRDAGFAITSAGSSTHEYIGAISLGDVSTAQLYYSQSGGTTPETGDFVLTGAANQCVVVYEDTDNGDFDYRDFFTVFAREQARIYDQADHDDIGVTTFTYQAYRFPVSNSDDLKIRPIADDAHIASGGTAGEYTNVDVTYFTEGQARTIGSTSYDFDIIIEGDGQDTQTIYEKIQYLLRQVADIDEGVGLVSGHTADLLLAFVGDTLVTSTGVYIDNFAAADTNSIEFYETGGTKQTFPFVAAGTINFNDNLYDDDDSIYRLFFTDDDLGDNTGQDFGTATAILVRSNDSDEDIRDISFCGQTDGNKIVSSGVTDLSIYTLNNMIEVSGGTNNGFWTITGSSAGELLIQETLTEEAHGPELDLYEIIGGNISAATTASFTYDYDFNKQRGSTSSGTTAPVTLVAIGLESAQYVKTTGNIIRSNANTLSLVAALERNYSNPA